MLMADRLTLDTPRRTADGYMAVRARAARTGVYQYAGSEVDPDNSHGLRDRASVNVLRDENTVFDTKAAHSFIGKPITDDHPQEAVTANNWRDHARGVIMGAMRDGDHLSFDLLITDAAMIAKVEAGKVEISNGYQSALQFGDFKAPDGTACQARQENIAGNHSAIVDRGRAGPTCAIPIAARCDSAPQSFLDSLQTEKPVITMLIDGLTVDVSNAETAKATITTILAARDTALGKIGGLETQVATLTTDKSTLEAEKVTLTQQLADASSPAKLRDAAKAYALIADKAKALGVTVIDTMDQAAIVKAVVDGKIDATLREGWTDAQYAASFASLTKDVKPSQTNSGISGAPVSFGDAEGDFAAQQRKLSDQRRNAWKSPATAVVQ